MFWKYAVTFILSALSVQVTAASLEFYPCGDECFTEDDGFTHPPIFLDPPLPYYGTKYNNCVVRSNGIIEVGNDIDPMPRRFQNDTFQNHTYTFIAPFYGDVHPEGDIMLCGKGVVKYFNVVTTDPTAKDKAMKQIREAFPEHDKFSPVYLVVATWDGVGYYRNKLDKRNTFQCVITTDGTTSFAIFLYNETEWTIADDDLGPAKVGFNYYRDMDFNQSCELPCSGTTDIDQLVNTSNVGTPGLWIFRIDGDIIPACPNKESCENDTLCSCLTDDAESCENDTLCFCLNDKLCSCLSDDPQQQCLCQESTEKVCMADDTPTPSMTPPSTTPPTPTPSTTPPTTGTGDGKALDLKFLAFLFFLLVLPIGIILFVWYCHKKQLCTGKATNNSSTDTNIGLKNVVDDKSKDD